MKITNELLEKTLSLTKEDFESKGVYITTKNPTDEELFIDYRYHFDSHEIVDLEFWLDEVEVNVTDEQLDIIFNYAQKLYDDEMYSIEECKKRSYDDPYEDSGVNPMMFI